MIANIATEAPAVEQGKTVNVTAFFRLSEAGQKAAVLAGLSAAKNQAIAGPLPVEHLNLCRIMDDGSVLLPSFTLYGDDAKRFGLGPLYPVNTPGSSFNLSFSEVPAGPLDVAIAMAGFLAAEAASLAQQKAEEQARREKYEAEYDAWIARLQADLDASDAIPQLNRPSGVQWSWDAESNEPVAVEIRRRRAAKAAAEEQAKADAAAAKTTFVRSWLVGHGTPDQVERFDADLLDEDEYLDAMKDAVFAPLAKFNLYEKISGQEVRSEVDDPDDQYSEVKAIFRSQPATTLTSPQWATLKAMRAALPDATIEPKTHEGSLDSDNVGWVASRDSALATIQYGPFEFRRDFAL